MSKSKFTTERKDQREIKDIFPNTEGRIEYAFTIDDTDFYQFGDISAVPCVRAFNSMTYYNELSQGCNREYLKAHNQAIKDAINGGKVVITDLVKLVNQLEERLDFITDIDVAYKLCSVVYFDKTENPYSYDYRYGAKKAQIFKECPMADFFLSQPISKLIPFTNLLGNDLPSYLETMSLMNRKHWEHIFTMLSEHSKNQESFKSMMLQYVQESHLLSAGG